MKRWIVLILAMCLLAGCQMQKGNENALGRPVISSITVTGQEGSKTFTSEEKMQQILLRLRRLGQKFTPAVDPELLEGDVHTIILINSDGGYEQYSTKADRFIRHNQQPWQQADAKQIRALNALLEELPPDV